MSEIGNIIVLTNFYSVSALNVANIDKIKKGEKQEASEKSMHKNEKQ